MTLDEAIRHCEEVASNCEEQAKQCDSDDRYERHVMHENAKCAAAHRQLAEWLTELKEARQLLKAAVEDFFFVSENFINNTDSSCSMYNHMTGCVKNCPMSSSDDYGGCKWRYAEAALKLLNDEK